MALLGALCAAGTGLIVQPLPDRLSGTWALKLTDCSTEGSAGFRVEVTAADVVLAALYWSSQKWKA